MKYIYAPWIIISFALSSCTINMHNVVTINTSRLGWENLSKAPFSLPRYDLRNNTLDIHISSIREGWILNLHLNPIINNDSIVLSGTEKTINDSVYSNSNFFIPVGALYNSTITHRDRSILIDIHSPDQPGKNANNDYFTISANDIDSSGNNFESKSYSGLIKDKNGYEYFFSSTTDPLPFLLIAVVVGVVSYEKGKCSGLEKKCKEKNQRSLINHHYWRSCELVRCY